MPRRGANGAAIRVQSALGPGLLVERAYRMDLVVDDRVVVEAKTVEKLVDAHFAQVNSQLRFSGFEVGLLLNFRQWPLKEGIKRVVHSRS